MNESTYHLQDGVKTAAEHPATFWMPPSEERENCVVGDCVKLILVNHNDAPSERLWVDVVEVLGGRYRGRLRHAVTFFIELDPYAEIEFGPEHIIQIWDESAA